MGKFHTAGARFFASIIDGLVFLPISYLFRPVAFGITSSNSTVFWSDVLLQFLTVSYYVLMHYYFGQTLGKMLLKVKVVDVSEQPISFLQSILRSLPILLALVFTVNFSNPTISSGTASAGDLYVARNLFSYLAIVFSLFSFANAITLLIDNKHRALHDYIAGTVVVKTNS